MLPLAIPALLIFTGQWRYPAHIMRRAVAGLYAALLCGNAALYLLMGPTWLALQLVGWGQPILCCLAYVLLAKLRNGRTLFTLVTALLLTTMDQALINLMAEPATLPSVVAQLAVFAVQTPLIGFVCQKPYQRMLLAPLKNWRRLALLPFALILCLLFAFVLPASYQGAPQEAFPVLAMCAAVVMIYISLYHLLIAMGREKHALLGSEVLTAQISLMEQRTGEILAREREGRIFRHDLRHYLNLIDSAITEQNMHAIKEVTHKMDEKLHCLERGYPLHSYTGNLMLDTVLSYFAQQAELDAIDMTVQFTLDDGLRVDIAELAVVLSNALENALAAARAVPGNQTRFIKVKTSRQTRQFFLSLTNTCSGCVQLDDATGLPVAVGEGHGYGTQSMAAFAKKYDAIIDFNVKENIFYLGLLI